MEKINYNNIYLYLFLIFTGIRVFNPISLYNGVEHVIICPQKCGEKYKTNSG